MVTNQNPADNTSEKAVFNRMLSDCDITLAFIQADTSASVSTFAERVTQGDERNPLAIRMAIACKGGISGSSVFREGLRSQLGLPAGEKDQTDITQTNKRGVGSIFTITNKNMVKKVIGYCAGMEPPNLRPRIKTFIAPALCTLEGGTDWSPPQAAIGPTFMRWLSESFPLKVEETILLTADPQSNRDADRTLRDNLTALSYYCRERKNRGEDNSNLVGL